MKTLFLTLFLMFAFAGWAFAAPFLVCDPQAGVVFYNLDTDGTIANDIPAQPDGSIHYDLAGMTVGAHGFKLQAIGDGGWPSDWSDPFATVKPVNPLNLRVSGE